MTNGRTGQTPSPLVEERERRNSEVVAIPSHDTLSNGAIGVLLGQLAFGVFAIALLFVWIRNADGATRRVTDAMLGEVPIDIANPFAGTRYEAQLRSRYREPPPTQAVVAPAQTKPLEGIPAPVLDKAIRFYGLRCAPCHGNRGGGDGLAAEMIKPRPRSFADPAWQASVDDTEITSAILKGGASVGKSYMMPSSPDLRNKVELTSTLVRIVRSFGELEPSAR